MILKAAVVEARQRTCSGCEHAVLGPKPWASRKWWCGQLFNGNRSDRGQRAYLPILTTEREGCPAGKWAAATDADLLQPGDVRHVPDSVFHALWRDIHTQADPTPEWWATVRMRLPCGECRREADSYIQSNPPPWGKAAPFFAWSVALHNSVNVRHGKAELTVGEARRIWPITLPVLRPPAAG